VHGYGNWCVMNHMKRSPLRSRLPIPGKDVERISLSLGAEDKSALERIASEKRVSIAWVIRDAISMYLALPDNARPSEKPKG